MIIEINNLYKTFDKSNESTLDGISFTVNKNEIFGIIGPDGAGKTTLIRIMLSLIIQDSGIVRVCNMDNINHPKQIRSISGYMPGRFSLYQDLTVFENLFFFSKIYNVELKKSLVEIGDIWIQIEPFKNRLVKDLSGGMKQKLALSCVLINKPKILFLDEPTTGVDVVSRKEFWDLIITLQKTGTTIIISTPYMDEANICDRIAFFNLGKILEINAPTKIIELFPFHIFSLESTDNYNLLLNCRNIPGVINAYLFGNTIHLVSKTIDTPAYFENKIQNISIKKVKATLEDCFIQKIT